MSHGSLLVDTLDYHSQRLDESASSSSISRSSSGWVTLGEVRERNRQGAVYGSYHLNVGLNSSASSSYASSHSRDRQLEIRLTPSSASVACLEDNDVANGNIPYIGNIIVY